MSSTGRRVVDGFTGRRVVDGDLALANTSSSDRITNAWEVSYGIFICGRNGTDRH
jgi:hypothetical protein